jgi:Rhs element Vgr protein
MTAPSPDINDGSQLSLSIKVAGKEISSTYQIVSINTWLGVNKIPKATIVLFDGSPETQDFEASNLKTFLPGNKVVIGAGYGGTTPATIFTGVIVKQGIEITRNAGSKLLVHLTDEVIKMTLERSNALFEKIKDSDLIGQLIAANGLSKDVAATTTVHEEIVQYYASDWDLMLTRAEMNGLVVMADAGKVTVKEPDTQQSPVLSVKYGDSILDLDAEMDAATQFTSSAIKSYTWEPDQQKLINSGPGTVSVKEQGNYSSAELAKVFGVKSVPQQTGAPIEKTALQDWSSAELLKSKLAKIRGSVRFQGSALAKVGKTIELAGLGDRFNGTAFIAGVHHSISDGRWLTTVQFGLSANWFAETTFGIAAPAASGQLPAIKGLQTGVVKKVAKDPGGEFRVFVTLPLLQDDAKGVWARLSGFYASNKFGAVFYPEVSDEVIVGFMNEDPRYAVILGSVYSKKLPPLFPPDEKNNKKAITTRSQLQILFDDQDKIIEIVTPGKHSIKMDDKAKSITVKDGKGNTMSMSGSGIALESTSNLSITAKGNITIEAKGNLALKAAAKATMEGLQVAHTAKTQFTAKANLTAEVSGSAMLTLKGGLVKIN